jgi:molybdate transport system permease protein
MDTADLTALWLTVKLAVVTTCILMLVGTPLAWWAARTHWKGKPLVDAAISLPLVLPPTVLGFYLLMALSPSGPVGKLISTVGGPVLAFSFTGLVIGSVIYSLPFVVQPLQTAFSGLGSLPLEVAATLGASPLDRFRTVVWPMTRPGFITAAVLGFAHTVGEFGVVLMIGGNIPGRTQVLSIAIYDHVEVLEYGPAHLLSAVLLTVSFVLLLTVYTINRRFRMVGP